MSVYSWEEYEKLRFRLRCGDCNQPLYADDYLHPPPDALLAIDFSQTAYQCGACGWIGRPVVEEVRP